jgi:hypothetical protein
VIRSFPSRRGGCIIPIFDGFDEVAGVGVTPLAILNQLQELSSDSDCRILLTSRDEIWYRLIPEDQRANIRIFNLEAFNRGQINRYREKRFPNPQDPARTRFDELLGSIIKAIHPKGDVTVPVEDRIHASPLIINLIATEAEDIERNAEAIEGPSFFYNNPLYYLTHGIMNREHSRRHLSLTPAQQLAMMADLSTTAGGATFDFEQIDIATSHSGASLNEHDGMIIRSHPLFKNIPEGIVFRFDYLTHFVPAAWIADHLLSSQYLTDIENILSKDAGKSSPIIIHLTEMLGNADWRTVLTKYGDYLRRTSPKSMATASLWGITSSLLFSSGITRPSERTKGMLSILGESKENNKTFTHLTISGPINQMGLEGTSFIGCHFVDTQWMSCNIDETTVLRDCKYSGRVTVLHSQLQKATFHGLTQEFMDEQAQEDINNIFGKRTQIMVTRGLVERVVGEILRLFRNGEYYVNVSRNEILNKIIAPNVVKESVLNHMIENKLIETDKDNILAVVRKYNNDIINMIENNNPSGIVANVVNSICKKNHY